MWSENESRQCGSFIFESVRHDEYGPMTHVSISLKLQDS